jgi:hypothetical protein
MQLCGARTVLVPELRGCAFIPTLESLPLDCVLSLSRFSKNKTGVFLPPSFEALRQKVAPVVHRGIRDLRIVRTKLAEALKDISPVELMHEAKCSL